MDSNTTTTKLVLVESVLWCDQHNERSAAHLRIKFEGKRVLVIDSRSCQVSGRRHNGLQFFVECLQSFSSCTHIGKSANVFHEAGFFTRGIGLGKSSHWVRTRQYLYRYVKSGEQTSFLFFLHTKNEEVVTITCVGFKTELMC